jgi:hypothetical protein
MIEKIRREYLIGRIRSNSMRAPSGCLVWTATKNNRGYGLIHFAKAKGEGHAPCIPAHRAHYMAHHNIVLGRNQYVCHKCDNPACVEITHLFVGTPLDNARDMIAEGRKAKSHKLHTRILKFTNEEILAIRNEPGRLIDVAEKYNTSVSYVSKLRRGLAKPLVTGISDLV